MVTEPTPTVFLSHSHRDKRLARRLVRRLTAHGIKTWFDERELRLGTTLTASIRAHIRDADTLLVIASQASAHSDWVGQEIDFAREHERTVIPFFIEHVADHHRFRDFLGVHGTDPQMFADVVYGFMRDLFRYLDRELPAADPAVLAPGLRELAGEEPNLAPLILGCLESSRVAPG